MATPGSDTITNITPSGSAGADDANGAGGSGAGGTTPEGQGAAPQGQRPTTADLPADVLKFRLDQERERGAKKAEEALFAKYGVTSQAELDAKLKRFAELDENEKKRATEEEEKKRASMSSEERLRTENEQLKARIRELEGQLTAAQGKVASMRQGQMVQQQAADLVDPELLDAAVLKFAAHIKEARERGENVAKFDKPGEVRGWFRDLVTKSPRFARSTTTTPGAKPATAVPPKRPITTGASPARAVPPAKQVPAAQEGKTFRPGQKNSMNDAEAAEAIAKKYPGIRVPGLVNGRA